MTLDDLECQSRGFMDFFSNFRLRATFQEWIAPKSIEIDMDKLHTKFLALNIHFDGPGLVFLGSRKPAHYSIKQRYSHKSCFFYHCWPVFHENGCRSPWACYPSQQALVTSFFSRIKIDDFERPWTFKIRGFIDFCDLRLQCTLKNELQRNGWR